MKKLTLILACALACTGCTSIKEYQGLPAEGKVQYLKDKAYTALSNPRTLAVFKDSLVLAGTTLMTEVPEEERAEIAAMMWTSSTAYYSLSTGDQITPEQLRDTLTAFNARSAKAQRFVAEINIAWQFIYSNLSLLNSPTLWKQYLGAAAEAAQQVGALYK